MKYNGSVENAENETRRCKQRCGSGPSHDESQSFVGLKWSRSSKYKQSRDRVVKVILHVNAIDTGTYSSQKNLESFCHDTQSF